MSETILAAGTKAPAFTLPDQNGTNVSLKDFKGKKVALYFYPQDNTPTCTVEACALRDNFSVLSEKGITIIGISPDDTKKHKKFEEKHALPFTLLSDPGLKVLKAYGVWAEKMLYGRKYMGTLRTTFLINEKGKIEHVITKVKSKEAAAQILEVWGMG